MAEFMEPYRTNQFVVTISNISSPGFTSVSGLGDGEVESVDVPSGGSRFVRKVSAPVVKFGDITLERFMDGSPADTELYDWFKAVFTVDGLAPGSKDKRSGVIQVFQSDRAAPVMQFTFDGAWIKSSKFSDLSAGGTELMKQTIVMSVDMLRREPPVGL